MKRITLTILLALVASTGRAAEYRTYVGPDGRPIIAGKYWCITTRDDGTAPTVALVLDTGTSPIPPPPPTPPPVVEVAVKVDALIAVVVDPTKAVTAKGIAEGYRQMLLLVDSGLLNTADSVRIATKFSLEYGLDAAKKRTAWQSFVDGMDAITQPMELAAIVSTYGIAQAKLGGTPPPGPDPPPDPIPTGAAIVVLRDPDKTTADQSTVLLDLRTKADQMFADNPTTAPTVLILSPEAIGPDGKPNEVVTKCKAALPAGKPLPFVFIAGRSSGGELSVAPKFVLPAEADTVLNLLVQEVKP